MFRQQLSTKKTVKQVLKKKTKELQLPKRKKK